MMTSDVQHTPGPWDLYSAHPVEQYVDRIVDPKSEQYASIFRIHHDDKIPRQEAEANARLIAASPDLLAALKEITKRYATSNTRGVAYQIWKKAKDAIAKAEGRG